MKFFIVDAFTNEIFGGNPAGVVLLDENQDFPKKETMIKTASELRYSETAFVKILDSNTFNIRYFTPVEEIDLCGHATIASFYVLLKEKLIKNDNTYLNKTLAGDLIIEIQNNSILMDMANPVIDDFVFSKEDTLDIYKAMGLNYENQNTKLKLKKVSTGLLDIIMPVKDEVELNKINPDFEKLTKLSIKYQVVGIHSFTLDSKDGLVHTRNFAPLYGIDEEAATGTSNGALTYYLYKNNLIVENSINKIIQGEKMNRPSAILTQLILENDAPKVKVGGLAKIFAKGELMI